MKRKKVFLQWKRFLFALGNYKKTQFCSAIITAAGSGNRMGGISKQLLSILNRAVLSYSLEAFAVSAHIKEIIISAKAEEIETVQALVADSGCTKKVKVVKGGSSRQESVANAFYALDKESKFVAIHDGARPLIRTEDIDRLFCQCYRYGAVSAGHPMADSVKRVNGKGLIEADVDRSALWAVQTPQVFQADIYRVALALSQKDKMSVTDDNSMVTHAGFPVKLIDIQNKNFKLTTPEDLEVITGILTQRSNAK